jgi:hypothetical protein
MVTTNDAVQHRRTIACSTSVSKIIFGFGYRHLSPDKVCWFFVLVHQCFTVVIHSGITVFV